jgi:hypothetical protein
MRLRKHACALTPILVVACAGLPVPAVQAQAPDYSKVEFRSEKLADKLFLRFGAGEAAPSREFDEHWSKGLFSPDAFLHRVFIELNREPGPR